MTAQTERLWGDLGRLPHTRVDTELFHLAFHAGNLLDAKTLAEQVGLAEVRLLTDDYAPMDTLVFEADPLGEWKPPVDERPLQSGL